MLTNVTSMHLPWRNGTTRGTRNRLHNTPSKSIPVEKSMSEPSEAIGDDARVLAVNLNLAGDPLSMANSIAAPRHLGASRLAFVTITVPISGLEQIQKSKPKLRKLV